MIQNNILTLTYNGGKGHFNIMLDQFLPCVQSDLRKLLNTVDASEDAEEDRKALYGYINDKYNELIREISAPENRCRKEELQAAANKFSGLSKLMSKKYDFTPLDVEERPSLRKADVYAVIMNSNSRKCAITVFSGYKFKKEGLWFTAYKTGKSGYNVLLPSTGYSVVTVNKKSEIADSITPKIITLLKDKIQDGTISGLEEKFTDLLNDADIYIPDELPEELRPIDTTGFEIVTAEEPAAEETAAEEAAEEATTAPETAAEESEEATTEETTVEAVKAAEPEENALYEYGMKYRGFSIECQPMDGFVSRKDDPTGVYYDIIAYSRPLTDKEISSYELIPLNNVAEGPEEAAEEPETTREGQKAAEPETAGTSFEALAAAYITGTKISRKPAKKAVNHVAEKAAEKPAEPVKEEGPENTTPESEAVENTAPGYTGNDNSMFSPEEISDLLSGKVVYKEESYWKKCFYAVPYMDDVKLVYSVNSNGPDRIAAGADPKYYGFICRSDFYYSTKNILDKFLADINDRVKEIIPDMETAAEKCNNLDEYQKKDIEYALESDCRSEITSHFYKQEVPELYFFGEHDYNFSNSVIIDYIIDPNKMITAVSDDLMERYSARIYTKYIYYNKTLAGYNEILSDLSRIEHKILSLRQCVAEEKTVRVGLRSGVEVKVESRGLKHLSGSISNYYVLSADRHLLPQGKYRAEDIQVADIVSVKHGTRLLYTA